jgi:hypothetical protein
MGAGSPTKIGSFLLIITAYLLPSCHGRVQCLAGYWPKMGANIFLARARRLELDGADGWAAQV